MVDSRRGNDLPTCWFSEMANATKDSGRVGYVVKTQFRERGQLPKKCPFGIHNTYLQGRE